jgi:hypothetical protein
MIYFDFNQAFSYIKSIVCLKASSNFSKTCYLMFLCSRYLLFYYQPKNWKMVRKFYGTIFVFQTIKFKGDDEKYLLDDMLLSELQIRRLFDKDEFRKNGAVDEEMLWPDKTVKFFITEDFSKPHLVLSTK